MTLEDKFQGAFASPADKRISVFGLGYVGLPVAAVLASRGFEVIGVDISPSIVEVINNGGIHIVEPDLDMIVQASVSAGRLRATLKPEPADVFIIAVPTPFREGNLPDMSSVEAATKAIAPVLKKGDLVILESTSPAGTTENICAWIAEGRPDLRLPHAESERADLYIAHCPERVLPSRVLRELVDNDRIVGGISAACAAYAGELYRTFVRGDIHLTGARTAELAKLAENAFRDVNIAFANELSVICDRIDVNVWELIELANKHPRVQILSPGPGVGGHCIAIDPWFIVAASPGDAKLIRVAREVNDNKPQHVVERVRAAASRLKQPIIACLGLSYKADIDDLRASPALDIVETIAREKLGQILVVEPNLRELPASLRKFDDVHLVELRPALTKADIVLLLVDHRQFKRIDREILKPKILIDTRGVFR
ncbi:MAG TPA: UDP-N-acetyl-D-mannosamine dehydrogenase [Rhizomicrobium sp.]|jgi:UDP-N-acetyl-D-mannosaminuronic acid dehydrogenase|nr:UDP-N-acetyl-D-mannosamine dehydrogenase [Rhizomicrobium sp.]